MNGSCRRMLKLNLLDDVGNYLLVFVGIKVNNYEYV